MVLNVEEGLECEVRVDGIRLEHVSEFKYLKRVLDESATDGAECSRKLASGRRVTGAVKSWLMLGIYSFSVLESCMRHCLCLFLCMESDNVTEREVLDLGCTDGQPQRIRRY